MSVTFRSLAIGAATYLPGIQGLSGRKTGGTTSARYCYAVWLRHLVLLRQSGLPTRFETVLELGPGDSLGISMAALLCGARRCLSLDVVRYADRALDLQIFDELVDLFHNRADIPDDVEFPLVQPTLASYRFPADILPAERMAALLGPARVAALRDSIRCPSQSLSDAGLCYLAPWQPGSVPSQSVDLILSQTVLEYAPDLAGLYDEMVRWLKPSGVMSHEIDFKSFGLTRQWDGHWACPDPLWRLATGRRRHKHNRQPCSRHIALAEAAGCRVVSVARTRWPSQIARAQLTPRFRSVTDDDLTTSSALIQASKGKSRTLA